MLCAYCSTIILYSVISLYKPLGVRAFIYLYIPMYIYLVPQNTLGKSEGEEHGTFIFHPLLMHWIDLS